MNNWINEFNFMLEIFQAIQKSFGQSDLLNVDRNKWKQTHLKLSTKGLVSKEKMREFISSFSEF